MRLEDRHAVLDPGESIMSAEAPDGYRWKLENKTSRTLRLRLWTTIALDDDRWLVTSRGADVVFLYDGKEALAL